MAVFCIKLAQSSHWNSLLFSCNLNELKKMLKDVTATLKDGIQKELCGNFLTNRSRYFAFSAVVGGSFGEISIHGVQQPGKPSEPGNVRELENGPKESGKSPGILRKKLRSGKSGKYQISDQSLWYYYSFSDCYEFQHSGGTPVRQRKLVWKVGEIQRILYVMEADTAKTTQKHRLILVIKLSYNVFIVHFSKTGVKTERNIQLIDEAS